VYKVAQSADLRMFERKGRAWAHGLSGSWALALMGSWAHGLSGSWAHGFKELPTKTKQMHTFLQISNI
jgi:hypothetical protein